MINFKLLAQYAEKTRLPNMTPLIDLIFNLLLFFLLTYAVASPALQVELPVANTSQVPLQAGIQITLRQDGTLWLQGQSVREEAFTALLTQALATQKKQAVIVSAARNLPLAEVVRVMDMVQQAGARQLSLAVEPADRFRTTSRSAAP
jgi:biopolymer transport protein ExbD